MSEPCVGRAFNTTRPGQTLDRPCGRPSRYVVSRRPACGLHLAQVVKLAIKEDGQAVVAKFS